MMGRFDPDTATELGRNTHAPLSDAGNRPPQVHFEWQGPMLMQANPPGAQIECATDGIEDASAVAIMTSDGEHIAKVIVRVPSGGDLTEETIAIASALYWSWWRAMDMRGEAPGELFDRSWGRPAR